MHKLRIAARIWRAGLIALLLASCAAQPAVAPQPIAPSVAAETPTPQPAAVATQQPTATSTATSTAEASAAPGPVTTPAASPIEYLSAPQIAETIGQDMSQGVARYLLGADMQTPEEVQQMLDGHLARVTAGEGKTALVVLAETAHANPTADDLSQPPWLTSLQTALEGGLKLSASDLLLVEQDGLGQPRIWFTKRYDGQQVIGGFISADGTIFDHEKTNALYRVLGKGTADDLNNGRPGGQIVLEQKFDPQRGQMVSVSRFRIVWRFDDDEGKPTGKWQSLNLPHMRVDGADMYLPEEEFNRRLHDDLDTLTGVTTDRSLHENSLDGYSYVDMYTTDGRIARSAVVGHDGTLSPWIIRLTERSNKEFQALADYQAMAFIRALGLMDAADPTSIINMTQEAGIQAFASNENLPIETHASTHTTDTTGGRGWNSTLINSKRFPRMSEPRLAQDRLAFGIALVEWKEVLDELYHVARQKPPTEYSAHVVVPELDALYPSADGTVSLYNAARNANLWLDLNVDVLPDDLFLAVANDVSWWENDLKNTLGL